MKKIKQSIKEAVHRRSFFGKVLEIADKRRHAFNERVTTEKQHLAEAEKSLKLLQEHQAPTQRVEDAAQILAIAEHRLRGALRKREFWRNRYTWAYSRHNHWGSVLRNRRDRLRRWIQQHETFQSYMANGKPYEKLTPEAKHGMYLDFRDGNYITSTYEGYPGDGVHSTSSYHYIQNQPDGQARCWDAGAATREPMAKAQLREARRCPNFLTEMIGPENSFEYKNGQRYTLPEGDPLETMHDNHKHTCIADGAPT